MVTVKDPGTGQLFYSDDYFNHYWRVFFSFIYIFLQFWESFLCPSCFIQPLVKVLIQGQFTETTS